LKVEGKPRPISFFDRLAAGSRSEEAQLAAARGSGVNGPGVPVPLDRGRTVMFFMTICTSRPAALATRAEC